MKKKFDLANGQLEYARGMYQDSSSRAVELASELESLQKIFEPTKSKLDVSINEVIFLPLQPNFSFGAVVLSSLGLHRLHTSPLRLQC